MQVSFLTCRHAEIHGLGEYFVILLPTTRYALFTLSETMYKYTRFQNRILQSDCENELQIELIYAVDIWVAYSLKLGYNELSTDPRCKSAHEMGQLLSVLYEKWEKLNL